jgi:hypothetical protein
MHPPNAISYIDIPPMLSNPLVCEAVSLDNNFCLEPALSLQNADDVSTNPLTQCSVQIRNKEAQPKSPQGKEEQENPTPARAH